MNGVREGPTGPTAAYIAQITVNDAPFMKEVHTWHLLMEAVDTKPGFARTRCNFAEKSHAISVLMSLDIFSHVPVLHPRVDLQVGAFQSIVAEADTTY